MFLWFFFCTSQHHFIIKLFVKVWFFFAGATSQSRFLERTLLNDLLEQNLSPRHHFLGRKKYIWNRGSIASVNCLFIRRNRFSDFCTVCVDTDPFIDVPVLWFQSLLWSWFQQWFVSCTWELLHFLGIFRPETWRLFILLFKDKEELDCQSQQHHSM